jgi:hypothetical protein
VRKKFELLQKSERGQLAVRGLLFEARESLDPGLRARPGYMADSKGSRILLQIVLRIFQEANTRLSMERGEVAKAWTAMTFVQYVAPSVALRCGGELHDVLHP